jgi:hypothetical protein
MLASSCRAATDNNAARIAVLTRQPSLRRGTWIIVIL